MSSIIVCGWDKLKGPQIYTVGLGGSVTRQEIALSGSGSAYVYGFCDTNFKKGMTRQEAKELVTKALSLAMYRDNSSGGIIRMVDISKDGYTRDVVKFDDVFVPNN